MAKQPRWKKNYEFRKQWYGGNFHGHPARAILSQMDRSSTYTLTELKVIGVEHGYVPKGAEIAVYWMKKYGVLNRVSRGHYERAMTNEEFGRFVRQKIVAADAAKHPMAPRRKT